jgi:hypothetical protein
MNFKHFSERKHFWLGAIFLVILAWIAVGLQLQASNPDVWRILLVSPAISLAPGGVVYIFLMKSLGTIGAAIGGILGELVYWIVPYVALEPRIKKWKPEEQLSARLLLLLLQIAGATGIAAKAADAFLSARFFYW